MSNNYFDQFPLIKYNNTSVKDLSKRARFTELARNNPYVFLPYTIKDNEKPEDIAYHYYGSVDYTWLVYLANSIIDPYTDWPLSEENFRQYLIQKYTAQSGKTGYQVVDWTQNENITENIVYYYKVVD